MEPMTLGSAPSSPASPGVNPNFLPSFLMGDVQQPSTPILSTSPGRNRHSGNFTKLVSATPQDARSLRQKLFNQSIIDSPQSPYNTISEKAGPPKQGLFDQMDKKQATSPILCSTMAPFNESAVFNESLSRIGEDSLNYSRNVQQNFNESMNRTSLNRLDRIDSLWVTVFGFPPSALTLVMSQMSHCGPISDKKVPSAGNWVHVKFNNYNDVCRALSFNGKTIHNNIMIGVLLHHTKENKENESFTSPVRARSLRHSYVSPQSPNTVLHQQALPQKSTGLVTKAMEYVFGW